MGSIVGNINPLVVVYLRKLLKIISLKCEFASYFILGKISKIMSLECDSASYFILGKILKNKKAMSF